MKSLSKVDKDRIFISKSNNFILSYKRMGIAQRNVLNAILTKVEAKKVIDFVEFSLHEIAYLLGITVTNYDQFRQVFEIMKDIEVTGADNEGVSLGNLIGETKFLFNGMGIRFTFTDLGKKYFTNLGSEFTLQLFSSSIFNSIYAHEIWDLVSMIKNKKNPQIVIGIEDFRKRMGIEGKYEKYSDLRKRCLDYPIKEVNEKTGVVIEYTPIKVGRRVAKIIISVISVSPTEVYKKGGQRYIDFPETPPARTPRLAVNSEDDIAKISRILVDEFKMLADEAEDLARNIKVSDFYATLFQIRSKRGTYSEIKTPLKMIRDLRFTK